MTTSDLFKLNVRDIVKGIVTAVFVAVVVALAGVVQTPGFNIFTADWVSIGQNMFNAGIVTLIGYLAKNFVSDSQGKVFGKI